MMRFLEDVVVALPVIAILVCLIVRPAFRPHERLRRRNRWSAHGQP